MNSFPNGNPCLYSEASSSRSWLFSPANGLYHDLQSAATTPNYVFITPDLDHDMHDGSIAQGDAWLSAELPKLMATDNYKKGGVIFVEDRVLRWYAAPKILRAIR